MRTLAVLTPNKLSLRFYPHRNMNTKVVIWFLSLALNRSYAYVLPKWSDIFSSLEPYKDEETLMLEEMEDNGEPRIGFVQVFMIFFRNVKFFNI